MSTTSTQSNLLMFCFLLLNMINFASLTRFSHLARLPDRKWDGVVYDRMAKKGQVSKSFPACYLRFRKKGDITLGRFPLLPGSFDLHMKPQTGNSSKISNEVNIPGFWYDEVLLELNNIYLKVETEGCTCSTVLSPITSEFNKTYKTEGIVKGKLWPIKDGGLREDGYPTDNYNLKINCSADTPN